jgi:glycosyltransferase involved in cell wall biosynthesis
LTANGHQPKASVIIPTYNASGLLRDTLRSLTRQRIHPGDFELVVADDGSSDDTRAVAESFSAKYYYQEDLGFRAGTARNGGAALAAAPVLIFVDTGIVTGPDFVARHLAAHQNGAPRMIAGYNYGFDPDATVPGLREALMRLPPEGVVEQYRGDPVINDVRHRLLSAYDFDLGRMAAPWMYLFTANCSIRAEGFWTAGGFDERFTGWGGEDMEFAYRVSRCGVGLGMAREAWAIETPVERDMDTRMGEFLRNMAVFLEKYPEPCVEIGWALCERYEPLDLELCYQDFLAWRDQVRGLDVADEVDTAMRRVPPGDKVAIVGCGGRLPASFSGACGTVLVDFDAELLDRVKVAGPHVKQHAIGLRTQLADKSVDSVIITSRVSGLRERWKDSLLAEAHRIGRSVQCVSVLSREG